MKFRPLHRVVAKRLEEELKTKGGIIIPDTAAEKPQTGQVVAAGPGSMAAPSPYFHQLRHARVTQT